MDRFRVFIVAIAMAIGFAAPAAAEKAIVVLDGSGSMWAQIDGQPRIEMARETLRGVLDALPEGLELGLMTYGHRERGDCGDIELLVAPATGTGPAIIEAAARINPRGKTPISDAVRLAAEELRYTEERATVILITDGIETCEADPCSLASDLENGGIEFTTYVLGLGLTEAEGEQVACLAENTGGQYFAANDLKALAEALTTSVASVSLPAPVVEPVPEARVEADPEPDPEPEPEPVAEPAAEPAEAELAYNFAPRALMSAAGQTPPSDPAISWQVFRRNPDGTRGESLSTDYYLDYTDTLDPGDYIVVAQLDRAEAEQSFTISPGQLAEPVLVLDAAILRLHPRRGPGQEPVGDASVIVRYEGGETTEYGEQTVIVPAGEITIEGQIGKGSVVETFRAEPGETVDKDVVVGVGHVIVNAAYVADMPVEDGGLTIEIVAAKKSIDGSRKSIDYGYGPGADFDLPPGDYVALLKLGETTAEVPFTVATGELTEVNGILEAGVIAVSAPGARQIEVFSKKKDIQGNRKPFGYGYDVTFQTTLPAGEYVVVATAQDDTKTEAEATIVAGERTEITME